MSYQLVYPITFYLFFIFGIMVWNFFKRVAAIKDQKMSAGYFKTYSNKENVSQELLVIERHVDNQFQLPVIFMMTCAFFVALDVVTPTIILMAWLFVALRLVHSFIHLGKNKILQRAIAYALGWGVVLAMWGGLFISLAIRA